MSRRGRWGQHGPAWPSHQAENTDLGRDFGRSSQNPSAVGSPPHRHCHTHLPAPVSLPRPRSPVPLSPAGHPLTVGLQLGGEDLNVLHLDFVDAGVLRAHVLDLEAVVLPQLLQAVLGVAVGAEGDFLSVLRPGEKGGSRPLPLSHSGSSQLWSPTGPGTWPHVPGPQRRWGGRGCGEQAAGK